MELVLQRLPSDAHRTHGDLFIDGAWECYTLEDVVREVKVHGETAIWPGRYRLTMENSPRFGPDTITVNGVRDFVGVRIHAGNDETHTEGCPLVGKVRAAASILQSKAALAELKPKIKAALQDGGEAWLEVRNG